MQGDDAASRGGQVHDVPGDDGSRLERLGKAGLVHPGGRQRGDVLARDLREAGVTLVVVGAAVRQPLGTGGLERRECSIGDRGEARSRRPAFCRRVPLGVRAAGARLATARCQGRGEQRDDENSAHGPPPFPGAAGARRSAVLPKPRRGRCKKGTRHAWWSGAPRACRRGQHRRRSAGSRAAGGAQTREPRMSRLNAVK